MHFNQLCHTKLNKFTGTFSLLLCRLWESTLIKLMESRDHIGAPIVLLKTYYVIFDQTNNNKTYKVRIHSFGI